MAWHQETETVLKRFLSDPAADAALTLFSAFYTAERITSGKVDEESKGGVIRMLVGLTYGLPNNAWFRQHGAAVMPVFAVSVNAWLDACQYFLEGPAGVAKGVTTRAVIMEVASACLVADKGIVEARKTSRQLRDQLAAVKME